MSNQLFNPGREGFLAGEIDWDTAVIKVALVRGYTFDATDKFVSEVTAAGGTLVATSSALGSKSLTDGVADAADVTFTSVAAGSAITGIIIFQASAVTGGADVAAGSQRLIAWLDGNQLITLAASASSGATSITVDAILANIASGATLTKVSGTGPTTATTSSSASAGARTISVSALSSSASAEAVYSVPVSGNGLPITPDGNNITLTWDNGSNKIFKL